MNRKLRDSLNNASKEFGNALANMTKSITSILRMLVLSRCSVARKARYYPDFKFTKDCVILANGPSLKKAFEDGEVPYEGKDVFVVNMFVQSSEFWKIKPRFYCIVDGAFFAPVNERTKELSRILGKALNKVDWEMYLYISSAFISLYLTAA